MKTSSTRQFLRSTLRSLHYVIFECLLTPLQFGIPNSRLRYYMLAKVSRGCFPCSQDPDENKMWRWIPGRSHDWVDPRISHEENQTPSVEQIRSYLDDDNIPRKSVASRVPDRVLAKWGRLFDIVVPSSRRSCCFTRGISVSI